MYNTVIFTVFTRKLYEQRKLNSLFEITHMVVLWFRDG